MFDITTAAMSASLKEEEFVNYVEKNMKQKTLSMSLIQRLIQQSIKSKTVVQIKGTPMFLRYTQTVDGVCRFVVYDRNPEYAARCVSVRLALIDEAVNGIEGYKRFETLARSCGVNLYFKAQQIQEELRLWDRILRGFHNYLYSHPIGLLAGLRPAC